MGVLEYDITNYQPILFAADGLEQLLDVVGGFFAECDDDSPARLSAARRSQRLSRAVGATAADDADSATDRESCRFAAAARPGAIGELDGDDRDVIALGLVRLGGVALAACRRAGRRRRRSRGRAAPRRAGAPGRDRGLRHPSV